MKKLVTAVSLLICVAMLGISAFGCTGGVGIAQPKERLKVATTSSLYDTGLWAVLEPLFEDKYGVELDVLYAGTGIAIEWGRRGDVDVLAVHDKARELSLIADGFGTERVPFAYNYFIIAGPASDPAGIKGLSPEAAFAKLAESKAYPFISRGDDSGTHAKEKAIWEAAGYSYADIQQSGNWYVNAGRGMGPTLVMAGEMQGYTLSDVGTFLAFKGDTGLDAIVDSGDIMLNVYAAIPINPEKIPAVNNKQAQNLVDFLVSSEIQKLIGDYGVKDYGDSLFTPCAGNEPAN